MNGGILPDAKLEKRSPIKVKPPRQAGESLRRRFNQQHEDLFHATAAMTIVAWVMACLFWFVWATGLPPLSMAIVATAYAVGFTLYSVRRIKREKAVLDRMVKGLE